MKMAKMLYKTPANTLLDFLTYSDMDGYRKKEKGPLFIDKEYLPQEIIDLAEAMIRGEESGQAA